MLAGSREAGFGTINLHLAHEQMRGWYALDEGGGSGSGTWYRTRTNWPHSKERPGDNHAVAMPHGWAIAEFWLLLRDSIAFEDGDSLVVFGGVPPEWFQAEEGMVAKGIHRLRGTGPFLYFRSGRSTITDQRHPRRPVML